jgi:hypothetical protein
VVPSPTVLFVLDAICLTSFQWIRSSDINKFKTIKLLKTLPLVVALRLHAQAHLVIL